MKIVLGSQSKPRQRVLRDMGLEFEVMSPGIDEKAIRFGDPKQLTLALAHAKADALIKKITKSALLITSDQVVVCNEKILEKPETPEEARQCMQGYAHFPAQTVTAVVVTNTETRERQEGVDTATVWMKPFPEDIIEQFIRQGGVFSWAGGFSVEKALQLGLVKRMEGAVDSVMGLPIILTRQLLQASGAVLPG